MRSWLCLALLFLSAPALGDWPQWRGPDSNAAVPAGDYPVEFSPTKNVVWKIDLPGPGASTPAVIGQTVFVTCEVEGEDTLCRYGLDGSHKWTKQLGQGREGKHRLATGANPSPVVDEERVYAYYKSGRLVALTHDGQEVWQRELQAEFGPDTLWWDLGSSPILTEAGVLIAVMQAGGSYLATFDRATGELVWKQPRDFDRPEESDQSYTTPALVDTDQGPRVVVWGADFITGHDPVTGEERFRCGGFNPDEQPMWRSIASSTIANGLIVTRFGRGDLLAATKLGGTGDITDSSRQWTLQGVGADVACPIIADGKVYVLGDRGEVTCVDLSSGEKLWSGKLPRGKGKYFSSPLLAGDLLYCLREDGVAYTARVGDGLELLATNDLEEEVVSQPTPITGGRLLVRTRTKLYLFGEE